MSDLNEDLKVESGQHILVESQKPKFDPLRQKSKLNLVPMDLVREERDSASPLDMITNPNDNESVSQGGYTSDPEPVHPIVLTSEGEMNP